MEDQDDIGPLMADDIALAMVELLGVFRMSTGAMLNRTIHEDGDLPGETFEGLKPLGQLLGLRLGEIL
jgi:hypothetical protein